MQHAETVPYRRDEVEDQLEEDGLACVEADKSRCVFLSREGLQDCVPCVLLYF